MQSFDFDSANNWSKARKIKFPFYFNCKNVSKQTQKVFSGKWKERKDVEKPIFVDKWKRIIRMTKEKLQKKGNSQSTKHAFRKIY